METETRARIAYGGETAETTVGELRRFADNLAAVLEVPAEQEFGPDGFLSADDLTELGERVINKHPGHFAHITANSLRVVFLWKLAGGENAGRLTFGKCQKPSGLLKHFSGVDFVIWLAADHCRMFEPAQFEALLFHELCHVGSSKDAAGKVALFTIGTRGSKTSRTRSSYVYPEPVFVDLGAEALEVVADLALTTSALAGGRRHPTEPEAARS